MVRPNKGWLKRFMPEITWGKIIVVFKQPKTTMWKKGMRKQCRTRILSGEKGMRKQCRTRILSGENFDLALGSMFL